MLVLVVLAIGSFAMLEPEGAEAAKSAADISAMLGISWFIWHLMSYE
jgi:hypothetical protein